MITLPAGVVQLSDRRTQRRWQVALTSYEIGVFPITRAEYGLAGDARRPAESVSWLDAVAYCNTLSIAEGLPEAYKIDADSAVTVTGEPGYRLPTEAEWEYACRAGTDGPRYGPLDEIAWYRGNSGERLHDVGGKRPNAWGLYDMLGNVWNWCWDLYDPEVYGGYRVLRGGGWFDEHWSCRASVRRRSHPTFRVDDVGFRVARSISP
ncbi:formylglycine-generating enzyme family protein [Actinoplanes solisilvae]|uniref:formylglycine-generating enzyme family protein n=1 Tax=Actinoplanes solisilvae TaxID=2486853 RepID=UPI000FDA5D9B